MSGDGRSELLASDKSTASIDKSIDQDIPEYERQFREILEHCPAGLNVVDEDGRLWGLGVSFIRRWAPVSPGFDANSQSVAGA
jgi:hypothetical protein